jgi:hypothetical protein
MLGKSCKTHMTTDSLMQVLHMRSLSLLSSAEKETESPESGLMTGNTFTATAAQTRARITVARSIFAQLG